MLSALKIAEFLWSAFSKKGLLNQGPHDLKITKAVLKSYEMPFMVYSEQNERQKCVLWGATSEVL